MIAVEQLLAARALQLGGRERGGNRHDGRVQRARAVGVVELDRVRVDAVREDGPLRPQRRPADDGGERRALVRADGGEHARDRVCRVDGRAAGGAAEVVEQQLLRVATVGASMSE